MKKGWQTTTLGEVCDFEKVQGIHRGLPYVGLEHIESQTARFIGSIEPQPVKSATFRFSDHHVLYGRLRPYLNKAFAPDFEGHCSTEIFPLKPRPELSREFLLYWLLADATCDRINSTCTGARMPRAQMNDVLNFEFPLPPLAEQQRIVGILDEAFEGIATAKANAEKNLQNARALFESYSQRMFEDQGAEWKQETMVDVCSILTCGVASTPKYVDEHVGVPFLSAQNVKDGEVVLEKYRFISREFHEKLTKKNKPRNGDILYSRVGAKYGEAAVVEHDFEFSVYVSLTLIRPIPEKLGSHFLMYYLNSPVGKSFAKKSITSSGVPNLNVNDVRKFPVGYPSMKQQLRIVDQLKSLNAETQRLATIYERKLAALDDLKKSLLHQAFSGQL